MTFCALSSGAEVRKTTSPAVAMVRRGVQSLMRERPFLASGATAPKVAALGSKQDRIIVELDVGDQKYFSAWKRKEAPVADVISTRPRPTPATLIRWFASASAARRHHGQTASPGEEKTRKAATAAWDSSADRRIAHRWVDQSRASSRAVEQGCIRFDVKKMAG